MNDRSSETAVEVISLALFDIHAIPGDSSAYTHFKHRADRDARRILAALAGAGFKIELDGKND